MGACYFVFYKQKTDKINVFTQNLDKCNTQKLTVLRGNGGTMSLIKNNNGLVFYKVVSPAPNPNVQNSSFELFC